MNKRQWAVLFMAAIIFASVLSAGIILLSYDETVAGILIMCDVLFACLSLCFLLVLDTHTPNAYPNRAEALNYKYGDANSYTNNTVDNDLIASEIHP